MVHFLLVSGTEHLCAEFRMSSVSQRICSSSCRSTVSQEPEQMWCHGCQEESLWSCHGRDQVTLKYLTRYSKAGRMTLKGSCQKKEEEGGREGEKKGGGGEESRKEERQEESKSLPRIKKKKTTVLINCSSDLCIIKSIFLMIRFISSVFFLKSFNFLVY